MSRGLFHKYFTALLTISSRELEGTDVEQIRLYTINLAKTKRNGDFQCPKCEISISPTDLTKDTYTILETVMKDESLEKIIIECNRCGAQIHLVGFELSNKK
jgi:hypothetical protein